MRACTYRSRVSQWDAPTGTLDGERDQLSKNARAAQINKRYAAGIPPGPKVAGGSEETGERRETRTGPPARPPARPPADRGTDALRTGRHAILAARPATRPKPETGTNYIAGIKSRANENTFPSMTKGHEK